MNKNKKFKFQYKLKKNQEFKPFVKNWLKGEYRRSSTVKQKDNIIYCYSKKKKKYYWIYIINNELLYCNLQKYQLLDYLN